MPPEEDPEDEEDEDEDPEELDPEELAPPLEVVDELAAPEPPLLLELVPLDEFEPVAPPLLDEPLPFDDVDSSPVEEPLDPQPPKQSTRQIAPKPLAARISCSPRLRQCSTAQFLRADEAAGFGGGVR